MQNQPNQSYTFNCSACHRSSFIQASTLPSFCPLCGHLQASQGDLKQEIAPPYQIIQSIGKGGMGEVFAAFDPSCKRHIAIKRIRPDLIDHPQIRHRFLKEARITCQLTHPAIIPIYAIESNPDTIFYTMPLVQGETLKQILRKTRQQERQGEKLDHIGGSIPALMRIFMTICQAIAYAHSKKVIHRDLKPENIIIGPYGEVLILDWGLAKWIDQSDEEDSEFKMTPATEAIQDLYHTQAGKVVGTIPYMAPERALGVPATIQTDIYSLGVILYQMLALKNPFKRKSLEEFRRLMDQEELIDPILAAPHRDVPKILAQCALKCLAKSPQDRYRTVDELIHDLAIYVEGRSEWFFISSLNISEKEDWEFQENILIAEHVAITRLAEETEWVSLMISRQSFTGNTKFEASINLGANSHGIGLLFSIPEAIERAHLNEGYCLWIGSDSNRNTKLLRSNVEIMQASDIFLKRQHWYKVRIEKIEKSIHFYIDDVLQFSYLAHLPLIGTHIGLLSRDADFEISPIQVYVGSLNLTVNCLAVPDAFLAHQDYPKALSEYRRIAYSFPDRPEGREALFRAGLTFIEQAKDHPLQRHLLDEALQEFEKLHGTPSAPLQYLGKALVYEMLNENEEEVKCFELAYRRYPHHPLLVMLQEQIVSRVHEVSRKERLAAYRFILLTIRYLPSTVLDTHTQRLFKNLQKHWELLPFLETKPPETSSPIHLSIPLAFWLAKPYVLEEILNELLAQETKDLTEICNIFYCFLEWGAWPFVKQTLNKIKTQTNDAASHLFWVEAALACHFMTLQEIASVFQPSALLGVNYQETRAIFYFIDQALDQKQSDLVLACIQNLENPDLSADIQLKLNINRIWAYLQKQDWQKAGEIFSNYSLEFLNKDSSILHFLYACWLLVTESYEISHIHLTGLFSVSYPRSWTLASHYLIEHISLSSQWAQQAFIWEKRQLYRQLALYYHCAGDQAKQTAFEQLYQEKYIHVEF